jgi:ATP-dependent DNA helicase RecG
MFEASILEGKPQPDFTGTDEHQVTVLLLGDVQNPEFLRFLEKAGEQARVSFSIKDLLALDALQRGAPVTPSVKGALSGLLEQGIVEQVGQGRGARFMLSRKFYSLLGRRGAYTRRRGLDRATQKALLVQHIAGAGPEGARLSGLQEVLKELSRAQLQALLRELRSEGKITVRGMTNAARWFLAEPER